MSGTRGAGLSGYPVDLRQHRSNVRERGSEAVAARRRFLGQALTGVVALTLPLRRAGLAAGADARPVTRKWLTEAYLREMEVHEGYLAFAGVAKRGGYAGVAYLFTAFSHSEGIHSRNFRDLLRGLGGEAPAVPGPAAPPASAKDCLVTAAKLEMESIDEFYPRMLEAIRPEGYRPAILAVEWARGAEQQHRDIVQRLRRYSAVFFEKVARTIDEKTGVYYVCEFCGSVLNRIPVERCPICNNPSTAYVRIEPPT
jgi:rubrerythrin